MDKVVTWNATPAPAGVTVEKVYPLPDVEKHEVRLVAWMAVQGTRGLEEVVV